MLDYMLTVKNEGLATTNAESPPLTNPAGPLPGDVSLSVGNAAAQGASGVQATNPVLGIGDGQDPKNILFIGLVIFLIFKYGRKLL